MRFEHVSITLLVPYTTVAVSLWASSYGGGLAALELNPSNTGTAGGWTLKTTAFLNGTGTCGPDASWLTKDSYNNVVYCVDEAWGMPNGSITSYKPSADGNLTLFDTQVTLASPVSTVVYNGGKALAASHYDTSAVTTWSILSSGGLKNMQTIVIKAPPGPNTDRQAVPHEHEVILDPTSSFIVVPDLGADRVHVFGIDPTTSLLRETEPLIVPPGSGPRHGVFLKTDTGKTFFFLISELANTIASYEVMYEGTGLNFTQVFLSGTYGDTKTPDGAGAAEVLLSPDHRFLLTSSRHVSSFLIPNFDTTNSTKIPSDALIVWTIDQATGRLYNAQLTPAGGINPRQMSLNKKGDMAAVGLQDDGRIVIIERNITDGTLGDFIGSVLIPGSPTCVIWNE